MTDPTPKRGLLDQFNDMTGRAKLLYASVLFVVGVVGYLFSAIADIVDASRWPARVDSDIEVLMEQTARIPPLEADLIILKDIANDSAIERKGIITKTEELQNGQIRLTIRLERLDERTGGASR